MNSDLKKELNIRDITLKELDVNDNIIIYGATIGGVLIYNFLKMHGFKKLKIVDRNKKNTVFYSIKIYSPVITQSLENCKCLLVLTTAIGSGGRALKDLGIKSIYSVSSIIKDLGDYDNCFEQKEDKYKAHEFKIMYDMYLNVGSSKQFILPAFAIVTTYKCTLKCKLCNMLLPYFKEHREFSPNEIVENLNIVLNVVDKIGLLNIAGGEPFVYKKTQELLKLIMQSPNIKKIKEIRFITNGTIIPSDAIIKTIKKYNIAVEISDYGKVSHRLHDLVDACKNNNIRYSVKKFRWVDFGFPKNHDYSHDTLVKMLDECILAHCEQIHGNKFYRCGRIPGIEHVGKAIIREEDFVTLNPTIEPQKMREKLIDYINSEYLDACRYCNGYNKNNTNKAAGVQLDCHLQPTTTH